MLTRSLLLLTALTATAADWSPQRAAQYLDTRQKEWFAWKQAQSADGPCISCHTGLTYLLARPTLRRFLHEKQPTIYETGLLNRLRAKAGAKPAGPLQSVETIFAAMFLAGEPEAQRAFDQLWTLQATDGQLQGAWRWYDASLDPWETPDAFSFGAALGAIAIAKAPAALRADPAVKDRINALAAYLGSTSEARPLHSRLAILWALSALPELELENQRQAILNETFAKQFEDGGWNIGALGPWMAHADAPVDSAASHGSNAYATAFATFVLQRAGVPSSDKRLLRARAWLKSHQDRTTGAWPAQSLNKVYPPDSMQVKFVQDAATAFAALALAEGH